MSQEHVTPESKFYLVGGGIASLAAAAFLIRDGNVKGSDITILEASDAIGGSLDAAGDAEGGYVMRGGRMLESKYVCTFDLFSSIPTLAGNQTVTEEILDWNATMKTASRSRLFRKGRAVNAPEFGLSEVHIRIIERLEIEPEGFLGRTSIADQFDASFFKTDFWFMWCSTFAFQPWHSAMEFKRYIVRFMHMISGFNMLSGIMRTKLNQYDSLVWPLHKWLSERGVKISFNHTVQDLVISHGADGFAVDGILSAVHNEPEEIQIRHTDFVIVTLGSMTEGSTLGSMDTAPVLTAEPEGKSWALWRRIAEQQLECGQPDTFADHVPESKWTSFTTTLNSPLLFDRICNLTGNAPGEGGLITFPESNWLTSIVLPSQPHFIGQPVGTSVMWGYGLFVDKPGNFIEKRMSDCSGREIMTEILGHLHLLEEAEQILESCICIPCMMPFITSQFLPRLEGDRPEVVPKRSKNLAFIGEFCELPDDVVFTVEYSIRSAQTAGYQLLDLPRTPPPVYKGNHDARVLLKAFLTLHGKGEWEAILTGAAS